MVKQLVLGVGVVVGRRYGYAVHAHLLRLKRHVDGELRACAGYIADNRHASAHFVHYDIHAYQALFVGQVGEFARGAGHPDAVYAVVYEIVDQPPQRRHIHAFVGVERREYGDYDAFDLLVRH